jgi:hypothetical protein
MTVEELEHRIRVLEDIESIKKLKAMYCYLVDAEKWDELYTHFADAARVDFGPFGSFEGHEGLKNFFGGVVAGSLSFAMHMVHDPIIEIKGNRATGKWYFEVPATARAENRAVWLAGMYEEEYVKEAGEWKFDLIKAKFNYATPYDEGWVKTPGI